jgi:hypothetical protein
MHRHVRGSAVSAVGSWTGRLRPDRDPHDRGHRASQNEEDDQPDHPQSVWAAPERDVG